jgi:hypothetical protein
MNAILTIAVLLVVGWFAAGTLWNVRKGSAVMRWMQGGLPLLGARATVRWFGSTSVELGIASPRAPFERVTLVIVLEPRDVPWLWWLDRRRGRRDTLIVRALLRKPPQADLEVLDPASWSSRALLERIASERWSIREPAAPGGLPAYYRTAAALAQGDALLALASRAGLAVRRLALRQTEPHLQLHLDLPPLRTPAGDYFEALHALGDRAERPRAAPRRPEA